MPAPSFVLELREKIGHDLLWLPGVTAVVVDETRRILLVRRSDNGQWTLVTGCLEPGEQPSAGAIREVWEETAVAVGVVRVLRVQAMDPSVYPNGDRVQFMDVAVLCQPLTSEARVNDDESLEVGWFSASEMPKLSHREAACVEAALGGAGPTWFDLGNQRVRDLPMEADGASSGASR
jgi:ADP-ribose pyrophosphatase YjhB (NUDIX family)